jgi:hypothetical protein
MERDTVDLMNEKLLIPDGRSCSSYNISSFPEKKQKR